MSPSTFRLFTCVTTVAVVVACARHEAQQAPAGAGARAGEDSAPPASKDTTAPPTLMVPPAASTQTWELRLHAVPELEPPRMVEAWVMLPEGVSFVAGEPGTAAQAAGKAVHVQERGSQLRIVILASGNVARMEPGALATLTVSGDGALSLDEQRSRAAPGGELAPGQLSLAPTEVAP